MNSPDPSCLPFHVVSNPSLKKLKKPLELFKKINKNRVGLWIAEVGRTPILFYEKSNPNITGH